MALEQAFVLKKQPYGESDEIITALLEKQGVQRFFARGSRKSKKRFGGQLDVWAQLQFDYLPKSQGLWSLLQVQSLTAQPSYASNLRAYAFLSFVSDLVCQMSPEALVDDELFELCHEVFTTSLQRCEDDQWICESLLALLDILGYGLEEMSRDRVLNQASGTEAKAALSALVRHAEVVLQKASSSGAFLLDVF